MSQAPAPQAKPEAQPQTTTPKAKNRAFRITQAPRYQNPLEAFEVVAREEESGAKHAVTGGNEGECWQELHRVLVAKGCGGPAVEDGEGGSEYNEIFFNDEA